MTGTVEVPVSLSRLDPLFSPRGIAVIGASRDASKLGSAMTRSLAGFPGAVVGINPRDPDPAHDRYRSVAEAVGHTGTALDLAVLCVPAALSAAALTEAAAAGVRAALVCSGGYAEAGEQGAVHQQALLEAARTAGVALLGPNTSGFLVPRERLTASFVPGAAAVPAGPVAVVAASGGVNHALSFLLAEAGVGVSLAVGLGNAVDVGTAEVVRHLAADPNTRAVALHIESVEDGRALMAAVREVVGHKPVVALVVGRNDVAEFARSHTGALATSWRTTRAALRHSGAVLVDDERALVDAVVALSARRLPPAHRVGVGIVTAQAGPGLLHVDGLRGAGVDVPPLESRTVAALGDLLPPLTFQANPVDTGRPGETFAEVLYAVAADPGIGLTSVYALSEPDALDLPAAVAAAGPGPFVIGLGGPAADVRAQQAALRRTGTAALSSPAALTTAVRCLVDDARGRAALSDAPTSPRDIRPVPGRTPLDEAQAKDLLRRIGIATPGRRVCLDHAQAHRALAELPLPVAVKILDARILHKTEMGGVHLGIRDADGLDAALTALDRVGAERYLVESMAGPGVDLLVGASRDPVFGPTVLLGLGGTVAEALADVAVAPAPLSAARAAELADELRGRALLDGFRGSPVVDRAVLGSVVAALGDLLAAAPDLDAVEINPLRFTVDGPLALDAVITPREDR